MGTPKYVVSQVKVWVPWDRIYRGHLKWGESCGAEPLTCRVRALGVNARIVGHPLDVRDCLMEKPTFGVGMLKVVSENITQEPIRISDIGAPGWHSG